MAVPEIQLQQSRSQVVSGAVFGVVWCGLLGYGFVGIAMSRTGPWIVPLVMIPPMLAFGVVLALRDTRLAVATEGDVLTVRNFDGECSVAAADVSEIVLVTRNRQSVVCVHTRSGDEIDLDVIRGRTPEQQRDVLERLSLWSSTSRNS